MPDFNPNTAFDELIDEALMEEFVTAINALPRGTVGYAQAVAPQTPITADVDLVGLTVTFIAEAGRRYRITGQTLPQSSVANDSVRLLIATGAGVQLERQDSGGLPLGALPAGLSVTYIATPAAGATTYKLRMARNVGTGNVTNNAAAALPSFILVEDIGT